MDRDGFLEFDERNYEIMENHGKSWKPEVENLIFYPFKWRSIVGEPTFLETDPGTVEMA
jgi:hypothetical protein